MNLHDLTYLRAKILSKKEEMRNDHKNQIYLNKRMKGLSNLSIFYQIYLI